MSSQRYNCLYLIYLNLLQQQLFFPAANVITVYLNDYNHVFSFSFLPANLEVDQVNIVYTFYQQRCGSLPAT